jgi:hypothetical protein
MGGRNQTRQLGSSPCSLRNPQANTDNLGNSLLVTALWGMAEIISFKAGRVQHLRLMPRCDKCGSRLSFVEQASPVAGKLWNVFRRSGCKDIQWKLAPPKRAD